MTGRAGDRRPNATADQPWSVRKSTTFSGPGRHTLVAWPAFVEGDRVFTVRNPSWPPPHGTGESPIVASDIGTGDELWAVEIPLNPDDWTSWIVGVRDGRVYASRSGNGGSVTAGVHALDAGTGKTLWVSGESTASGPYDGSVFAPNGDLIMGSFRELVRIDATDGTTVWRKERLCMVSSGCGAVIHGNRIYIAENNVIGAYDVATGDRLYESPTIGNWQDSPFVGIDGTIYYSRTGNNPDYDRLFAFSDTGTELVEKWSVPSAWVTTSIHGVQSDNSVIALAPGYELVRRDGATGAVLDTAPAGPAWDTRFNVAIDADDKIYVSEGFSGGVRVYDPNLNPLFHFPVTNLNIGGPIIGGDGTLIANGNSSQVWAVIPVELQSFEIE